MGNKVIISLVAVVIIASACGGSYPFDTGYSEGAVISQEFEEGRRASNTFINARKDNPCLDDIMAGVPPDLQRCGNHQDILSLSYKAGTLILNRCPHGCKTHLSGCDIKGDISIASGDKIYIVPGQKKYKGTVIRPQYGERRFCAELDAIANGWRKANN